MLPNFERRELLGTALNLIPGSQILKALLADDSVPHASQTPEEMDFVDRQRMLAMENTENWFAMHAEHCINRITWNGLISDWSDQLHQKIDHFAEAAIGEDGGPGILITRAQMELLSWQTRASAGKAPCQTRLFVATMFLIDMTISYSDPSDQNSNTTFAAILKSKYPSLHESLVAALRVLNADEVIKYVNDCPKMEGLRLDDPELLRDHVRVMAPTIKDHIFSLFQVSTSTNEATA